VLSPFEFDDGELANKDLASLRLFSKSRTLRIVVSVAQHLPTGKF
jgi:hypothetical protein